MPAIVTPPTWRPCGAADAAEPTATGKPCEVMQLANATVLGLVELEVLVPLAGAVVVPRFAIDGDFDPPQPAATTPRHASAMTNVRRPTGKRTTLKQL